jgi:XTP/dITP diphosphohydrolase
MILYACSSNPGKLREFALAAGDVRVEPLPNLRNIPPPDETGATFEENARIKAVYYSAFTPELVFADDSGLEVDALAGAPGVHSARYAGPNASDDENNALLLRNLDNATRRSARFVCVIALARQGQILQMFRGRVDGEILPVPCGAGGFGYDPLFLYPPFGCSFAQLAPEEKFAVSHRGHALRAISRYLSEEKLQAGTD